MVKTPEKSTVGDFVVDNARERINAPTELNKVNVTERFAGRQVFLVRDGGFCSLLSPGVGLFS